MHVALDFILSVALDCILHSIILSTNQIKINFLFVKDHTKIILDKSINHNKLLNFFKFEDINFEKIL